VVHSFGGETLAIVTSGGESGKRFVQHLDCCGFPVSVVPIRKEIRTDLTITDKQGLTVNLNEAGPELSKAEIGSFERRVREMLGRASWLMLCGSLPPGVPASFYGKLVSLARQKKVKTLLHASGEALREGIAAQPTVATTNQHEAARLLGRALLTQAHYAEAARQLRAMGPESMVLTLGSRGAVAAFPDGVIEAVPPPVHAICPIGSGDALTAGYTWAMVKDSNMADALRWGVAAGTASARLPGMRFATLAQTREIYGQIELRRGEPMRRNAKLR
jgi:1-phosphofructokinase family hexose kinase